jgi:hypothetical protein
VPYPTEPNLDALFSVNRFNLLLREYAALIAYQISGKYQPQSPTEKQISETEANRKVNEWGCYLLNE